MLSVNWELNLKEVGIESSCPALKQPYERYVGMVVPFKSTYTFVTVLMFLFFKWRGTKRPEEYDHLNPEEDIPYHS